MVVGRVKEQVLGGDLYLVLRRLGEGVLSGVIGDVLRVVVVEGKGKEGLGGRGFVFCDFFLSGLSFFWFEGGSLFSLSGRKKRTRTEEVEEGRMAMKFGKTIFFCSLFYFFICCHCVVFFGHTNTHFFRIWHMMSWKTKGRYEVWKRG